MAESIIKLDFNIVDGVYAKRLDNIQLHNDIAVTLNNAEQTCLIWGTCTTGKFLLKHYTI